MAKVWTPVAEQINARRYYIGAGGKYIEIPDINVTLPDNLAVCRLVIVEDTAPCVPDEVLEALQTLTYLAIETADEVWIYHNETEMHALDSGVRWAGKIAREWLDAQKGGGDGDANS